MTIKSIHATNNGQCQEQQQQQQVHHHQHIQSIIIVVVDSSSKDTTADMLRPLASLALHRSSRSSSIARNNKRPWTSAAAAHHDAHYGFSSSMRIRNGRRMLSTSSSEATTTTMKLTSIEEHERRVAAAQALVLEQQQQRQERSPTSTATRSIRPSNKSQIPNNLPSDSSDFQAPRHPSPTEAISNSNNANIPEDAISTTTTTTTHSNNLTTEETGGLSPIHLHTIANGIQHWCSKDPTFFNSTMEALNLSALANSRHDPQLAQAQSQQQQYRQQGVQPNQHPLSTLVNQYRQLYYESIADFRNNVLESQPASLHGVLERLVEAGFGDPLWSKRYRQVRGYESRKLDMERTILKQQKEWERRRDLLQSAEEEFRALLVMARRSAEQHKRMEVKRSQHQQRRHQRSIPTSAPAPASTPSGQDTSRVVEQQPEEPSSSFWSKFTSWFSPSQTTPEQPTATIQQHESSGETYFDNKLEKMENYIPDDPSIYFDPYSPPTNRQRKRIRAMILAMQFMQRDVQDSQNDLLALQSNLETLRFPLPVHEYERARTAVQDAKGAICEELARHIKERHAQLIEQYQRLDAKTDLTKPHEWFSYARLDRRKIIFHSGPTNSGKTYNALERLKEAECGLYLGPLRLLAAEVYENLTSDGIYANLFTGQERREIAFSTHAAATVEMVNLNNEYDVVVIDEIQMISDVTRGAAWTKALLGLRCKEIHVCGGFEANTIVKKLADACGDEFELKKYERFSPLMVASQSLAKDPTQSGCYQYVQPGDCVVAFSRNDIFAIKREIEKTTGYRCCVIYGKLPPQTRADQARRFNDPDSGYDILVASDAIGMGLNLNIKRIIFNSIFKYNGEEVVRLSHSEIKQISGRAGRRNSPFPHGEVTCRDPRDLPYIKKCLSSEIEQIEKAALLPTSAHIELFREGLEAYDVGEDATELHNILRQFSAMATVKGDFFLGRQTEMQIIAKKLKGVPLSLQDAYTMCLSPTSESSLFLLLNFAWKLARGEVCGLPSRSVPKPAKSFDDLSYLCNIYGDADLFLWLQYKYPPSNAVEHQAALARKETTLEFINQALANTDKLELRHDYIRTAIRHRTAWEAENGPMDDLMEMQDNDDDDDAMIDESSAARRMSFDEDQEDDAYASFSDRRQVHG